MLKFVQNHCCAWFVTACVCSSEECARFGDSLTDFPSQRETSSLMAHRAWASYSITLQGPCTVICILDFALTPLGKFLQCSNLAPGSHARHTVAARTAASPLLQCTYRPLTSNPDTVDVRDVHIPKPASHRMQFTCSPRRRGPSRSRTWQA
jgi:hypothetical protein